MRHTRGLLGVCAALCIGLIAIRPTMAGDPDPSAKAVRRKSKNAAKPSLPGGGPKVVDPNDVYYGGTKLDTIKTFLNERGETVYSIAASHFDISAPLSEMAQSAVKQPGETEESPENPQLPAWRSFRSQTPDPVVQPVVAPVESLAAGGGPAPLAPVTGFNFLGVPILGGTPSDSNGAAGNNQYVETVNTRYQVWSLNRSTHVATSMLGPSNINTLWNGFGGACQAQNSGDPIVVFDKVASRWLISQFTTTASSGSYFQCVAVSTSANAAGTYARWAFTVPNGVFGDYPHFGVWSDAYYMMAHGFQSTAGGYVAAIFAAMDRTKMLAGDASATWQVIFDPSEGGHMPADLDGFAPPPTGAPGVFLSLHSTGMVVYRMRVDFATPANTVKTRQAKIPVAAYTSACGGGSCIPQPGTTTVVGSLADRLMFRAAYRNFIDHESIVVSHSVDPSVSGLVSGVRWYDIRLSGTPNATCSTYPCVYQQGTIADAPGGRSRWMPSIAMDSAENMVVGYSATGLTNGTDNQSIRYTGRAKNDAPGTMTVPEATLVTGTANNTNSRWGDYTCMAVDPIDDCTFWYVNQYFLSAGSWSTQIASTTWPNGSGAGQCQATGCLTRPPTAPTIGSVSGTADNQITVNWTGTIPTPGSYAIERADGACGSEGTYRPLASVAGTSTHFVDTSVQGGLTYSYRVVSATDAGGRCQGLTKSACASASTTGTCNLKPSFAGGSVGTSANQSNCGVTLSWTAATSSCPLTPAVKYNIFRGTVPDFVPSAANRIATCVPGPSSYVDTNNVQGGVTYYYVIRAEDSSSGNGGECGGGNEDGNSVIVAGTAYGVGTQASPGTWTDGAGDGTAFMRLDVPGTGDTTNPDQPTWRYVKTSNDPGANHTPGGAYAYRNAGPTAADTYTPDTCAEMQTPPLKAAASTVDLQYWERHQIEYHWDGIVVDYSVNGGPFTGVPPPSNDTGQGCAATDDTTGWETMSCTQDPPVNACGYTVAQSAFTGPLASGTDCNSWATSSVTNYAHRCHPISGLNPGDTIQFRWRFASDPGAEFAGFYLDDISVTNLSVPNACVPDTCAGVADATPCNSGASCTSGDACSGGACHAGPTVAAPPEIVGLALAGHANTTLSWNSPGGSVLYDVVSAPISDLAAAGTATATCVFNDVSVTSVSDGRATSPGDGFYYLVRAQSACGSGTYGSNSGGAPRAPAAGCP